MTVVADAVAVLLLLLAAFAFSAAMWWLVARQDLLALSGLAVGGMLLRSSVDVLRPRGAK